MGNTTKQDFFNRSYVGLYAQRFEKATHNGICEVRSTNGLKKCAIGWALRDDDDDATDDVNFELRLLEAHDNSNSTEDMQQTLWAIADEYDLTVPDDPRHKPEPKHPLLTMSEQEIFNKAYLGMYAQRFEKSMKNGRCRYNDGTGLRHCAIGWINPVDQLQEGLAVVLVLVQSCRTLTNPRKYFLSELQACHDVGGAPYRVESNLLDFAKKHNLTVPT